MLRKHLLKDRPVAPAPRPGEKNIAAIATVLVTSEEAGHPIEHVFDQRRGPGGSRWMAEEPGEQIVRLAFDTPQSIYQITVEVEEPEVSHTQELQLAISSDEGRTYREVLRQEYTFSPPGTAFEHEEWAGSVGCVGLRRRIRRHRCTRRLRGTLSSGPMCRRPMG
ncbi:MAG TPA: hypothetical protein VLK82_09075 [Candidatus Tectomicrobia bacterium]|nr:hypothetical protein [Candidatus Tectomicrobia bacterium]